MVSWKESIKMNIIGGYIDGSASGQVRLHSKMKENHELDMQLYERIDLWVSRQVGV